MSTPASYPSLYLSSACFRAVLRSRRTMVCAATAPVSPAHPRRTETSACRGKATILREGRGDPPRPPGSAPTRTRHAQPRETGRAGQDVLGRTAGGWCAVTRRGVFHRLVSIHRSWIRSLRTAGARYAKYHGPPRYRGSTSTIASGYVRHRCVQLVGVSGVGSDIGELPTPSADADYWVTVLSDPFKLLSFSSYQTRCMYEYSRKIYLAWPPNWRVQNS